MKVELNDDNKMLIEEKVDKLLPKQEKVDYAKLDLDIKELVSSFVLNLIEKRSDNDEKIDYDNYIREFIEANIETIVNELVAQIKPVEDAHIEDLVEELNTNDKEVEEVIKTEDISGPIVNPFEDIEERLELKVDKDLEEIKKYDPNTLSLKDTSTDTEEEEDIFKLNL